MTIWVYSEGVTGAGKRVELERKRKAKQKIQSGGFQEVLVSLEFSNDSKIKCVSTCLVLQAPAASVHIPNSLLPLVVVQSGGQPFDYSPLRFRARNGEYITLDTSWSSWVLGARPCPWALRSHHFRHRPWASSQILPPTSLPEVLEPYHLSS